MLRSALLNHSFWGGVHFKDCEQTERKKKIERKKEKKKEKERKKEKKRKEKKRKKKYVFCGLSNLSAFYIQIIYLMKMSSKQIIRYSLDRYRTQKLFFFFFEANGNL